MPAYANDRREEENCYPDAAKAGIAAVAASPWLTEPRFDSPTMARVKAPVPHLNYPGDRFYGLMLVSGSFPGTLQLDRLVRICRVVKDG